MRFYDRRCPIRFLVIYVGLTSYLGRCTSEVSCYFSRFVISIPQSLVKFRIHFFQLCLHLLELQLVSCNVLLLESNFPVELLNLPGFKLELTLVSLLVKLKLLDDFVFAL